MRIKEFLKYVSLCMDWGGESGLESAWHKGSCIAVLSIIITITGEIFTKTKQISMKQ